MATRDPRLDKRDELIKTRLSLGKLVLMVRSRLERMRKDDIDHASQLLVSYVLRNELEGGPINDKVVLNTYKTLNELLFGGIIFPEGDEE